ncbi:hypothetical protein, partial [Klebsiella pneumoniae]|uniref:hypothetical protein n=1 Tax=Klebsiella pneumoniae TaxID=573 RepID=UPI0025A116F4
KINGKCFSSAINLTIDGDTATAKFYLPSIINTTSVFNVLPSCDGCLVLSGNTTSSNLDNFLQLLNISSSGSGSKEDIHVQTLYLLASGSTVKDS